MFKRYLLVAKVYYKNKIMGVRLYDKTLDELFDFSMIDFEVLQGHDVIEYAKNAKELNLVDFKEKGLITREELQTVPVAEGNLRTNKVYIYDEVAIREDISRLMKEGYKSNYVSTNMPLSEQYGLYCEKGDIYIQWSIKKLSTECITEIVRIWKGNTRIVTPCRLTEKAIEKNMNKCYLCKQLKPCGKTNFVMLCKDCKGSIR